MIGYAMSNRVEFGGFGEPNSCPGLVPVGTRGTVAGGNEDVGQLNAHMGMEVAS